MTTQELGNGRGLLEPGETVPRQDALGALFDSSPASTVHTSAAAEIAFVAGLVALLAVPFSLMTGLCFILAGVGLVTSVVGLARSSRPTVAGGLLSSVGLVVSLTALLLLALRYVGIDTAVGDAMVPTLTGWLGSLNDLVPSR